MQNLYLHVCMISCLDVTSKTMKSEVIYRCLAGNWCLFRVTHSWVPSLGSLIAMPHLSVRFLAGQRRSSVTRQTATTIMCPSAPMESDASRPASQKHNAAPRSAVWAEWWRGAWRVDRPVWLYQLNIRAQNTFSSHAVMKATGKRWWIKKNSSLFDWNTVSETQLYLAHLHKHNVCFFYFLTSKCVSTDGLGMTRHSDVHKLDRWQPRHGALQLGPLMCSNDISNSPEMELRDETHWCTEMRSLTAQRCSSTTGPTGFA